MAMTSSSLIAVAVSCFIIGVNGRFFDPFEDFFHPIKEEVKTTAAAPSNPVTTHPAAPVGSDTNVDEMRRIIQEELKKYQATSGSEPKDIQKSAAPPSEAPSTVDLADMIRKIVSEELNKALPPNPPTSSPELMTPPVPIWKSWANTKYWAKQPGPNGEAPPGFIGSLQSRYGPAGTYNNPAAAPHPSGSPGWVWSQISSKWAKSDPTIVPPSQIVDSGDWEIVLPPQKQVKSTS